jgi:hypothetical protein
MKRSQAEEIFGRLGLAVLPDNLHAGKRLDATPLEAMAVLNDLKSKFHFMQGLPNMRLNAQAQLELNAFQYEQTIGNVVAVFDLLWEEYLQKVNKEDAACSSS